MLDDEVETMIIKRTKIVDNGCFASISRGSTSTRMKQIMNTKTEMKNKNKFFEENSHACI